MQERSTDLLAVHAAHTGVTTLGPGPAAALWVQGCARGCRGCMSPDTFDVEGGWWARVDVVATWLASTPHHHLTISGGEPMDQAGVLARLVDLIRVERDWIVTCYTGHRLAELRDEPPPGATELLDRIDLLIDGPYVEPAHGRLAWRGSSNQVLHDLTGRVVLPPDEPAGIAVHLEADGTFRFVGVPPEPRFVERFADLASDSLPPSRTRSRLPFPTEGAD